MPLRQMQVFVPTTHEDQLSEVLAELELTPLWEGKGDPQWGIMAVFVIDAYETEAILKALESRFSFLEHFRVVLFEVAAVYPSPKKEEEVPGEPEAEEEKSPVRVAIEELEEQLSHGSLLDRDFVITVLLSAVVAAVGLVRSNTAVVIGAMVIAPLLAPNISMALGTALGKVDLMKRSFGANFVGLVLSFGFAFLIGAFVAVNPETPEIASRTSLSYADLALALAAGAAGALAFTTGVPAALVGVMVAVALMPPIVCSGLLAGAGYYDLGFSAFLLTLANIIAVNLAAVMMFGMKKVRPRMYWQAGLATKMRRRAVAVWVTLLLVFALLIWLLEG